MSEEAASIKHQFSLHRVFPLTFKGVFEGNGKPFEFKIELQINVSKTSQL